MRALKLLLLAACLVLLLAAPAAVRAQTVITIWHTWPPDQAPVLEAWIAAYPPAKDGRARIQIQAVPAAALLSRLSAEEPQPDLILAASALAPALSAANLVAPVPIAVPESLRGQIPDVAWAAASMNGALMGIPVRLDGPTVFYNAQIVGDEFVPSTWEDLIGSAGTFVEPGSSDRIGLLVSAPTFYLTAGLFFAAGGELADANGRNALGRDNARALTAYFTAMRDLWAQRGGRVVEFNVGPERDSLGAFRAGRAAYYLGGSWQLGDLRRVLGEDLDALQVRTLADQPWRAFVSTSQFYLRAGTRVPVEALDFSQFAAGEAQQRLLIEANLIPANRGVWIGDEVITRIGTSLAGGVPVPTQPGMNIYWDALTRGLLNVLEGGADPAAEAAAVVEAIDQRVEAIRNPPTPAPEETPFMPVFPPTRTPGP